MNIGIVRQQNTLMRQQSDFEESTMAVDPVVVIKHTKINLMDFGSGPVNLKVSKSQTCPDMSPTSRVFFSGSHEKFDSIGSTTTATVPESLENVNNKLEEKGEAQLSLFRIRNWYNFEPIIQEYSQVWNKQACSLFNSIVLIYNWV